MHTCTCVFSTLLSCLLLTTSFPQTPYSPPTSLSFPPVLTFSSPSLRTTLPPITSSSGASQVMDMVDTMHRLEELRKRREELEQREKALDEQRRRMEQCLRNISEDTINDQYPTQPAIVHTCMCMYRGSPPQVY